MRKVITEQDLVEVHAVGAKRHPHTWFSANRAAARRVQARLGALSNEHKFVIALAVLAALDQSDTA